MRVIRWTAVNSHLLAAGVVLPSTPLILAFSRKGRGDSIKTGSPWPYPPAAAFSILAQESRNDTVRLNTSAPGEESAESTQKYPCLSNWN